MRLTRLLALALVMLATPLGLAADKPPFVILMVADGAGYNSWLATAMYSGDVGREFYRGDDWVKVGASTHPLRFEKEPVPGEAGLLQDPTAIYNPARAWDDTPVRREGRLYPYYFEGYRWLLRATDSASAATTLATGVKTYVGAVNVDGQAQPIETTLARMAKESGRKVGVVTSVPFNHATPAAIGGAHNVSRRNYCQIAWEMLTAGQLDLIAGAGNPDFDNNGRPLDKPEDRIYTYVGNRQVWQALTENKPLSAGQPLCRSEVGSPPITTEQIDRLGSWNLKQARPEIEALADGETQTPLLILPQVGQVALWNGSSDVPDQHEQIVGSTLQQERGTRIGTLITAPGDDPRIPNVPSLTTLTEVSLRVLEEDPEGFFLHIEGGAIDWAMHANQMGRMIEEMLDFQQAVLAVSRWVEAGPSWNNVLLVVTADHDHLVWGEDSDDRPFESLGDRGAGKMPEYRWLNHSHSNMLVPAMARGAGAERLRELATKEDPFYGPYLDQADIFTVLKEALK